LIKGGAHLEALGTLRVIAFDKTGTLTSGRPSVSHVWAAPGESLEAVLSDAAALERHAGHPLAAAIVARAAAGLRRLPVASHVTALPGRGMSGRVEGREILVGSHRLFDERGLCDHALDGELRALEAAGKTVVLVGGEGVGVRGFLAADDSPRPEATEAMRRLRESGLGLVMLTGDNRTTAEAIARSVGIVEWHAELLPDDKLAQVRALRARGAVAMVGDGVNDAPALAASDVGIAMGPRGTDVALETADVVLMAEDLRRLPWAVTLGRTTRRIVWQNVVFSLAVKGVVLGLALAGYGSLWAAVAADMGSSLLVIANGLRLLRLRP
jgi:Cd2+/Zn2+-exporting ATPase